MRKAKTQKEITQKNVLSGNFKKHYMRSAYAKPVQSKINCDDGITEQHHAEQCDVNNILATYMKTGVLPAIDPNAQYGDLSDFDYQSMQNQIANARSLFEQLPENVEDYKKGSHCLNKRDPSKKMLHNPACLAEGSWGHATWSFVSKRMGKSR